MHPLRRWWLELVISLAILLTLAGPPILRVFPVFFLVLLAPGLQVARWLGLSQRNRVPLLFPAIGLSLAISPIIVYWAGISGFFYPVPVAIGLGGFAIFVGVLSKVRPATRMAEIGPMFGTLRRRLLFTGLLTVVVLMVVIPYVQVLRNGVLIVPGVGDWPKHFAVVWAIEKTGIPPREVFYPPRQDQPFVYYYFFHIVVAAIRLLSGGIMAIRSTFVLVMATTVVAFLGLFYLLARRVLRKEQAALVSVLFVSLIGGLDLIPLLATGLNNVLHDPSAWTRIVAATHVEMWVTCVSQITNFYTFFIYTPHHLAAGLVFTLSLVLLAWLGPRWRLIALAPLLLFAVLGYSVYIAIMVFAAVGIYAAWQIAAPLLTDKNFRESARTLAVWGIVLAGFVAISFPYLLELVSITGAETGGLVFRVASNGLHWFQGAFFTELLGDGPLSRLLNAPLFYFLELGVILPLGIFGWWILKRQSGVLDPSATRGDTSWGAEMATHLLGLTAVVALVATVFVSSRGAELSLSCNDFRMRGVFPLQMALACYAGLGLVHVLGTHRKGLIRVVLALVLLGALATAWELVGDGLLRFPLNLGVSSEELAAFEYVKENTPEDAVFQGAGRYDSRSLLAYADRVSRVDNHMYSLLHVPASTYQEDVDHVLTALRTLDSRQAWSLFTDLGVTHVFLGPTALQTAEPSSDLSQFADPRYFKEVYKSGAIRIYQLVSDAGGGALPPAGK